MKAAKILGKELVEVQNVPIPEPGDGEVLVEMKASALCRSDLHTYHGDAVFNRDTPEIITPGHEPCGVVKKVGKNVKKVKCGVLVAIYLALGCGKCSECLQGYPMLCKEFKCIGFDKDGAHADYIVIPEYNCLPLPDKMSFVEGALATDVAGTLYTACKSLNVSGRTTLVIFGLGPMGSGGLLIAKAFGANVIAVDVDDKRLEFAKSLGADVVINSAKTNIVQEIQKITNGVGVEAAIDCSGNPKAEYDALECVRVMGNVGYIGECKSSTINPSDQLIRKLINLRGYWYFNISDWQEITDFIVSKKVPLEKICSHRFEIKDAPEAFRLFDSHDTQKVVFVWE